MPSDAERRKQLEWNIVHAPGYHEAAAIALREFDAAQSALAESQRQVESLTIKTPRELAMRETIDGQSLSMVAMGKELREKDKALAESRAENERWKKRHHLRQAEITRLRQALAEDCVENERLRAAAGEPVAQPHNPLDDEARRRRIISEACDRAFGPDGGGR
jgi:hypothetical protein